MYQSVIRDPGGGGLVRIVPDVCGRYSAVVNGSVLIVPPGTTAFVAINGVLSPPYGPGRYELFSGVDPFFVRLRNVMTRGDTATSVSVFFISTEKSRFMKLGTGELPFRERRFGITMKALASCSLAISVADPLRLLRRLIGSYSSEFSEEDVEPCVEQMVLAPIREAIAKELGGLDVSEFNGALARIGGVASSAIRAGLSGFGIRLDRFDLTAVNIPDAEMQRLCALEQTHADGKTRTDIELDHLKRIWGGRVNDRTLGELMTGMPSRGQPVSGTAAPTQGGGGMAPMMMEMLLMSQLLPALREPLNEMTRHTDMFGGSPSNAQESGSTADAPPPMPERHRRCPSCNALAARNAAVCPVCGHIFNERND